MRDSAKTSKGSPLFVRVLAVVFAISTVWAGYKYVFFQPDDLRDYGTITGTLELAEEHLSEGRSRSGSLDIKLEGSPLRYCVPADGYLDCFRRAAFFAEVPKGAELTLFAKAEDIAHPKTFLLNDTRTVFVRGVRVGERDYCTVQDHIDWQKRNNRWMPFVAAITMGLGIYFAKAGGQWKKKTVSEGGLANR